MKIVHLVFALLFAFLAGWFIFLATTATGGWKIFDYGMAVYDASLSFWHAFKSMDKDDE